MVSIHKHRCRCAPASNFLKDSAVCLLGKSVSAEFFRCSHPEDTNSAKAIDHISWNIGVSVDFCWIELGIEHLSKLTKGLIQFRLLRRRHPRVWHDPIGHNPAQKQPFGEPEYLRSAKKQLLSLLDFLFSLGFRLGHCHTKPPGLRRAGNCSRSGRFVHLLAMGFQLSRQRFYRDLLQASTSRKSPKPKPQNPEKHQSAIF